MERTYEEIMNLVGETANLAAQNTQSTSIILKRIEDQDKLLGGLSRTVSSIGEDVSNIIGEIDQLKLNEEVTTTQQETIIEAARKRVCEILGSDEFEQKKYFKIFVQKLYGDTRKNAGLGSKIARTRKGDFQRCIDYIESWIPSCGCAELRNKADKRAEARRKARELGYDS